MVKKNKVEKLIEKIKYDNRPGEFQSAMKELKSLVENMKQQLISSNSTLEKHKEG